MRKAMETRGRLAFLTGPLPARGEQQQRVHAREQHHAPLACQQVLRERKHSRRKTRKTT